MSKESPIVITGSARTPIGSFQGALKNETAPKLGAVAIKEAIKRANIKADDIDEVTMGCVLPAGLGQAPARQASIYAGIPDSTGATTVNKMCGSGMKATMLGYDSIKAGTNSIVITGGIESMTNSPYLLPKGRAGLRLGHGEVKDHMFLDGLEDAYEGKLMGVYAEDTARHYQFTRDQQDAFTIESVTRAQKAVAEGFFKSEIAVVNTKKGRAEVIISEDEEPGRADISKIPNLRPVFAKDGSVTAANSSSISDGAAAFVLMSENEANKRGSPAIARIIGHATHAQAPQWFTTAPVKAIEKLLDKVNWTKDDVDLFEINEAFAVVTMAAMRDLNIPHDKVNVHGGACALGHPIGASAARIIVTLIGALQKYDLKRGVAGICIGGGEATAMAIELI
jgi:acetyl-CoA C-acetyltransferase